MDKLLITNSIDFIINSKNQVLYERDSRKESNNSLKLGDFIYFQKVSEAKNILGFYNREFNRFYSLPMADSYILFRNQKGIESSFFSPIKSVCEIDASKLEDLGDNMQVTSAEYKTLFSPDYAFNQRSREEQEAIMQSSMKSVKRLFLVMDTFLNQHKYTQVEIEALDKAAHIEVYGTPDEKKDSKIQFFKKIK